MTDTRRRVHEYVRANPGVHFNALKRGLDIATGQAQYHLRRLCRNGDLEGEHVRGRTHYFDAGAYDAWERRAISLCRHETARDVLAVLLEEEELPAATVADRLGIARSTLSFHVSALADAGLVAKEYGERGQVVLSPSRPEETRELLAAAAPTLADRLVDRFMRLVDAGLDPPAEE